MIAKSNHLLPGGRYVLKGAPYTEEEIKKYKLKDEKKPASKAK